VCLRAGRIGRCRPVPHCARRRRRAARAASPSLPPSWRCVSTSSRLKAWRSASTSSPSALAVLRLTTSFIEIGRFAAERRERRGIESHSGSNGRGPILGGRTEEPSKPRQARNHMASRTRSWTVDGAECRESSSRALHAANQAPNKASMKDVTQEPTQPDYNGASPRTRGDYHGK
jgi:hypothetical protein